MKNIKINKTSLLDLNKHDEHPKAQRKENEITRKLNFDSVKRGIINYLTNCIHK